ncbi:hypothetical protein BMBphi_gp039 [Bacillus phage vB_BthS_BMBphi]|nr:hypothetical protein BMBphi_gp039 [Bacillus phage vB_BthS_BMBphi]
MIGLDISPTETGVSIVDRFPSGELDLVFVDTIVTAPSRKYKGVTIKYTDGERLNLIRDSLWEILDRYIPDTYIKEGQGADMNKFRSVSLVSKATGVIEECIEGWHRSQGNTSAAIIHAYPPSTIKKEVTGFGGVDKTITGTDTWSKYLRKKPVIDAVLEEFNPVKFSSTVKKLKGVERTMYNDNECDSVACILTHLKKKGLK